MLELKNVTLRRGTKFLLEEASVRVEHGCRTGLIGRNGTGKTSLFQLITGGLHEDLGSFSLEVKRTAIAYLEQALPHSDEPAIEYVKSGDLIWSKIQADLRKAELEEDGLAISQCYTDLQAIDGFTIEGRASSILNGLGFTQDTFENPVSSFSGGWQMRLQLARTLLAPAELLLLDEPTNHLDIEAILWLEKWLQSKKCSMLIISHDRDFLDNVCTHTLHLRQRTLKLYTGNYTSFARQFEMQLEQEASSAEKIARQRAHMQSFVDRFRYKASKAKQAQSRMKAIEKLTMTVGLQRENPFSFHFFPCEKLSDPIIKMDVSIGYDKTVILEKIGMNVNHDDRIAFLGRNGGGKSTLMKTLAEELPPITGEITKHPKLKIGYFSQQQLDTLDYDSTPFAHVQQLDKKLGESDIRKYLGGFGFSGDCVFDSVRHFSGGEKARLALALLIYHRPNLLLLDEPTNHLDLQMREALIIALQTYQGAVVLVSHDRYFVSSITDQLYWIAQGKLLPFDGDLDDYQKAVMAKEDLSPTSKTSSSKKENKENKAGGQPMGSKQLKKLETKLATLKQQVEKLETDLGNQDLYLPKNAEKLASLLAEHKQKKQDLEAIEDQLLSLE
ncbi:MAG: ATP-binding cassette domain-containing protein [Gammaproteobacteria bacterium]|nr:ATP-binding cassette domain-containing protein [Gammaproteobacteria bacterium]